MKPNNFLTETQADYINAIKVNTDTAGMNLGIAHDIRELEKSMQNHIDSLLHQGRGIERLTEQHHISALDALEGIVRRRDEMVERGE